MTNKEMIEVMQGYEDGKEIEYKRKCDKDWNLCGIPLWDWLTFDYRIKPEPQYVPYDSVEEVDKEKLVTHKNGRLLYRIGGINTFDDTVFISTEGWKKLDTLFERSTYEDGTPCGKKVEQT